MILNGCFIKFEVGQLIRSWLTIFYW